MELSLTCLWNSVWEKRCASASPQEDPHNRVCVYGMHEHIYVFMGVVCISECHECIMCMCMHGCESTVYTWGLSMLVTIDLK